MEQPANSDVGETLEFQVESTTTPSMDIDSIPIEKYDELVHYFKYASSTYILMCPKPCGNTLVSTFSNTVTDIQGFVAKDSGRNELVVALRGSASLADVILDAQIVLVPLLIPGIKAPSGVRVHAGFLTAWDSVAIQVLTTIRAQLRLHPGITSITTTGHSLGGSIALLAAVSLAGTFPTKSVRTYSYGSPRTGNRKFAELVRGVFGDHAHRVVHGNDGVPTMIPAKWGYHHHGIEYWQNGSPPSEGNTFKCDPDGEDPRCSLSIPSRGINGAHTRYFGILVSTPFCL